MKMILKIIIVCILCLLVVAVLYLTVLLVYASFKEFKPEKIEKPKISGEGITRYFDGDTLEFLTWNIGYAGLGKEMDFFYEGGQKVRPSNDQFEAYFSGILGFLERYHNCDFILLQEVDINSKRSYGINQFLDISKKLPGHSAVQAINYKSAYVPVPWFNSMGRVESGIAIFSRLQPVEALRFSTPGSYSWPESLFMLKRCILFSRYKIQSDKDLVVMNIHNSAFEGEDSLRMAEMKLIKDIALQEFNVGNYVVIGGDWNQNPPGWNGCFGDNYQSKVAWPISADFFSSGWKWAFDPSVPTNRNVIEPFDKATSKTTILDYFLVSPNMDVLEIKTVDLGFKYSDHQPVKVALKLQ